ncbi:hypothetical protein SAMN04515647_3785 [Cohaesibacter sp. ES.047]|uniref:hypothetical protein n=1 Tax=Cohaesibacter sp. ES.047 TaxID=1798205 RepID=UPI000BB681E1|nr:hypothetical protein [Cohaesibacter sp. ES.047]SNY93488.1 hypothetical protein SAMN04515647_3785 [Cohaesibacter sp. ES.047]
MSDEKFNEEDIVKRLLNRESEIAKTQKHQFLESTIQSEKHVKAMGSSMTEVATLANSIMDRMLRGMKKVEKEFEDIVRKQRSFHVVSNRKILIAVILMIPVWATVTMIGIWALPYGNAKVGLDHPGKYTIIDQDKGTVYSCEKISVKTGLDCHLMH